MEDVTQAALTFCMPTHGRVPRAENEAVASDRALRDLFLRFAEKDPLITSVCRAAFPEDSSSALPLPVPWHPSPPSFWPMSLPEIWTPEPVQRCINS